MSPKHPSARLGTVNHVPDKLNPSSISMHNTASWLAHGSSSTPGYPAQ